MEKISVFLWIGQDGSIRGYSVNKEENTIPFEATQEELDNIFMYKLSNDKLILDKNKQRITDAQENNLKFQTYLNDTDWIVTRHRDQIDSAIKTTLSDKEFQTLLRERQNARDSIVNK